MADVLADIPLEPCAMRLIFPVRRDDVEAVVERPDAAKVLAGDPVHTTWSLEEKGNLFSGMWQTTPGKWRVSYAEWEYVHIHAGHSILTDADGVETHLRAGDSYIIRPGFEGSWECVETTLKDYVILG
jgi:uncharacterized cupin superfamily protein